MQLNKMGVPFKDGGISTSTTKNKKYYLCEKKWNMIQLNKIKQR